MVAAALLAGTIAASAQVSSGSTDAAQQNAASKQQNETPGSGKWRPNGENAAIAAERKPNVTGSERPASLER